MIAFSSSNPEAIGWRVQAQSAAIRRDMRRFAEVCDDDEASPSLFQAVAFGTAIAQVPDQHLDLEDPWVKIRKT
jgi:hypothetical protein